MLFALIGSLLAVFLVLLYVVLAPGLNRAAQHAGVSVLPDGSTLQVPDLLIGTDFPSYKEALELLDLPDIAQWNRLIRGVDWIYPLFYGSFLFMFLQILVPPWNNSRPGREEIARRPVRLHRIACFIPILAMTADYAENMLLLSIHSGTELSQRLYRTLQVVGLAKFSAAFLAIAICVLLAGAKLFKKPAGPMT